MPAILVGIPGIPRMSEMPGPSVEWFFGCRSARAVRVSDDGLFGDAADASDARDAGDVNDASAVRRELLGLRWRPAVRVSDDTISGGC